jgi:hypothetical protein
VETVEQLRPQRLQELVQRLADEQDEWISRIDACMEQLAKINTTASLAAWYRGFPSGHPAFRAGSFGHLNMRGTGGSEYAPAAVLAELREAFTERAAPTHPVMPVPDAPKPLNESRAPMPRRYHVDDAGRLRSGWPNEAKADPEPDDERTRRLRTSTPGQTATATFRR